MESKNNLDFVTFEKQNEMPFSDFITRHLDDIVAGTFAATGANMAATSSEHPFLLALTFSIGGFLTWLAYTAGSALIGVLMKKVADKAMDRGINYFGSIVDRAKLAWRIRNRKGKK